MLREQVLQALNDYKAKVSANQKNQLTNSERKFFELVSSNLFAIPPYEKDILETDIGKLKRRADSLVQKYYETYQKYTDMNLSEDDKSASFHLDITYLAYSNLHKMYLFFVKALEDALNSSDSRPTIVEVD